MRSPRAATGRRTLLALAAPALLPRPASAAWPERQLTMIVPFPAGNASDIVARILADRLGERFGGRLVVDNRPGAGGSIGTRAAAGARDGHTLVLTASGPLSVNRSLFRDLGYDVARDFDPIGLVATTTNILTVTNGLPARSVEEFVALARARPGRLNYGTIGNGSSQHLAGVLFEEATGVELTHVPYRGATQLMPDLATGRIESSFQLVPNMAAQLRAGQVRPLAVMAAERLPTLPDVPTMAEAGVPRAVSAGWFGMLAPKGLPVEALPRLREEVAAAVGDPSTRARLIEAGTEPAYLDAARFADFIEAEAAKWGELVRRRGIQPD